MAFKFKLGEITQADTEFLDKLVPVIWNRRGKFIDRKTHLQFIHEFFDELEEYNLISDEEDLILKDYFLFIRNVECRSCGTLIRQRRPGHFYCKKCYESSSYPEQKRMEKGLKSRGGRRPGAGRPKKMDRNNFTDTNKKNLKSNPNAPKNEKSIQT